MPFGAMSAVIVLSVAMIACLIATFWRNNHCCCHSSHEKHRAKQVKQHLLRLAARRVRVLHPRARFCDYPKALCFEYGVVVRWYVWRQSMRYKRNPKKIQSDIKCATASSLSKYAPPFLSLGAIVSLNQVFMVMFPAAAPIHKPVHEMINTLTLRAANLNKCCLAFLAQCFS